MNFKDLMQSEYETMASMEIPMPDKFMKALDFIKAKVAKKEYMDIESAIYEEGQKCQEWELRKRV